MILKSFSKKTQVSYVRAITGLAQYYNKSPDLLDNDEIQNYLLYLLEEKKQAWSSCNVVFSALKLFYREFLKRDASSFSIPGRVKQTRLPEILSINEVSRILKSVDNYKHRMLLTTLYDTGLRVSEALNLKSKHIDTERMVIRVEQGKGAKDRYTILSKYLLDSLMCFINVLNPESLIFPSNSKQGNPLHPSVAGKIFNNAKKKVGIIKGRGAHTLRHCFATHMLEAGMDLFTLQKLLGHKHVNTTMRYLHLTKDRVKEIKSPLYLIHAQGIQRISNENLAK